MLELGTFGSVRGVPGNGYLYRNPPAFAVARPLGPTHADGQID